MKSVYILDLVRNQLIDSETFAIYESEEYKDKNGNSYYSLIIGDKSGKLSAKIWADKLVNVPKSVLRKDNVVQISGKVEEYKGKLQINIFNISQIDESALDEFLESSEFDPNEMFADLLKEVNSIKDSSLRSLLSKIFEDQDIVKRYKFWPAASTVHHDFRSGLIQHVTEMLSILKCMPKFYKEVNYDLLTAAIILHDIGKIYEFDASGVATSYTVEGSLIGHIVLGVQLIDDFGAKTLLSRELYIHLVHLILSHHGTLEFGSPVLPATVEAMMLTNIDNLSSKSRTVLKARDNITKGQEFSSFIPWIGGARVWRGYFEDEEPTIPADVPPQTGNGHDSEELGLLPL